MQLEHSFTVPVGIDEAWKVLLDIERIAPCMPGAAVDSIDGDDFTGTVKVKLGPISLTYKGKASFVEKDEAAHRVAINAQGRDARGNGTAAAKVTATLTRQGDQTQVDVLTDLDITGKPAQFGRGVMVDVGNKLIGQFADCLAGKLSEGVAAPAEPATAPPAKKSAPAKKAAAKVPAKKTAAAKKATATKQATASVPAEPAAAAEAAASQPAARVAARPAPADVEPIDLLESAGPAVAKRLAPVLAVLVLVLIVWRLRKR
jgi:carbon monoxide dehydrogenase subunit G